MLRLLKRLPQLLMPLLLPPQMLALPRLLEPMLLPVPPVVIRRSKAKPLRISPSLTRSFLRSTEACRPKNSSVTTPLFVKLSKPRTARTNKLLPVPLLRKLPVLRLDRLLLRPQPLPRWRSRRSLLLSKLA